VRVVGERAVFRLLDGLVKVRSSPAGLRASAPWLHSDRLGARNKEPTFYRREQPVRRATRRREDGTAMEPASIGGSILLAAGIVYAGIVPQWSPPFIGGSTGDGKAAWRADRPTAMEPTFIGGSTGHRDAGDHRPDGTAMEPPPLIDGSTGGGIVPNEADWAPQWRPPFFSGTIRQHRRGHRDRPGTAVEPALYGGSRRRAADDPAERRAGTAMEPALYRRE
jgi:hypothetical protein